MNQTGRRSCQACPGRPCPGPKTSSRLARSKASTSMPGPAPVGDAVERAGARQPTRTARPRARAVRDRGEQVRARPRRAVGLTDRAHHAVLGAEPRGIALALDPKAGDDHGERAADQRTPVATKCRSRPNASLAATSGNRHGHGQHGYEHGLPEVAPVAAMSGPMSRS